LLLFLFYIQSFIGEKDIDVRVRYAITC